MLPLPTLAIKYLIMGVLAIVAFMLFAIRKDKKAIMTYVFWQMAWCAFMTFSIFWTLNTRLSLWAIFQVVLIFIMTFSVVVYVRNFNDLKRILKAYYVAALVMMLYVFSFMNITNLEGSRLGVEDDSGWNPNYISTYLALAIYAGYYVIWRTKKCIFLLRTFYLISTTLMLVIIALSGSRTGFLAMLIPLFVIYVVKSKNAVRGVLLGLITTIITVVIVMKVPVLFSNIGERLLEMINILNEGEYAGGDASRLFLANYGIEWFKQSPLFGYGINCFRVMSDTQTIFAGRNFYAHNNYVELLVDVGIVGFMIYYYLYFYMLKKKKYVQENIRPVFMGIFIFLLFVDIANVSYYDPIIQLVIVLEFLIIQLSKQNKNKKHEEEFKKVLITSRR